MRVTLDSRVMGPLAAALPALCLIIVYGVKIALTCGAAGSAEQKLEGVIECRGILDEWHKAFGHDYVGASRTYRENLTHAAKFTAQAQQRRQALLDDNQTLCDELAILRGHLRQLIKLCEEKGSAVPPEVQQRVSKIKPTVP